MDLRRRLNQDSDGFDTVPRDKEIQPSSDDAHHVPIKILERRIQSFTQTTVPHDLNRLRQHKENIELYHKENNWTKLDLEQVNASRTVQQLKTHMQTIDELRHQLCPADHARFISLTHDIRNDVQRAIEDYGMAQSKLANGDSSVEGCDDDQQFDELASISDQSVLIPRSEAAYRSWEELRSDLLELNELTQALQSTVKVQREVVSQLEKDVDAAALQVQHGEAQIQRSTQLRGYVLPVGGAIVGGFVGGIVAGPIGALAGLKVGALSAAAAGTAGAIGGAFFGFKAKEHNEQARDKTVHDKQQ